MTITYITVMVGFVIPSKEYLQTIWPDIDDNAWEILYDCKGEKLLLASHQGSEEDSEKNIQSEALTLEMITHDVDKTEPIAIGVKIGEMVVHRGYRYEKSDHNVPLTKVLESLETLKVELESMKTVNRQLYDILSKMKPELVFVQDDCRCCS